MTTRIQKFNKSVQHFIDLFEPPIQNWELVKEDFQHSRGSRHSFSIQIPSTYSEEIPSSQEGNITWSLEEKQQDVPNDEVFRTKFDNYFGPCRTQVDSSYGGWVEISLLQVNEYNSLHAQIILQMNKGKLPFPTEDNQCDLHYKRLEEKMRKSENRYIRLLESVNNIRRYYHDRFDELVISRRRARVRHEKEKNDILTRMYTTNSRFVNEIAKYYTAQPNREDCSICWEKIEPNKLTISSCCHYFCSSCAYKAFSITNKCPVCRCIQPTEFCDQLQEQSPQQIQENPPNQLSDTHNEAMMQQMLMDIIQEDINSIGNNPMTIQSTPPAPES